MWKNINIKVKKKDIKKLKVYLSLVFQMSLSLIVAFYLLNTFKLDLKSFQLKLKKLKMIILIFERGVYLFLKTSYSNISSFFF